MGGCCHCSSATESRCSGTPATACRTWPRTGVSVRTVYRVKGEDPVRHVDDAAERGTRGIGRPAKAEPFRAFVTEVLATEPGLMSLEILRRARLKGYTGGKSALYELIAGLRPPKMREVVRFEGLPGEFSPARLRPGRRALRGRRREARSTSSPRG